MNETPGPGSGPPPPPPLPPGVLSGLRVVDLTGNLAGPYCGQILADLGADVVKVERPGAGDPSRAWAPPAWGSDGTLFLASNRGKRSLALELDMVEGREVLEDLLAEADVAIQAFRPDVAARFGVTEEHLRPTHPRLILCTIHAFDPSGPDRNRPGYDPLLQAHAGLMSVTGPEGGPPVRVGTSLVDLGAGMWAALGVLSALRAREASGRGSHVQVSLMDTALAWGAYHLMGVLAGGGTPAPMGTGLGMISPYGALPASDGLLLIAAGNDTLFLRCCRALGADAVASDPRFATNPDRVAHRRELEEALSALTVRHTREELEDRLREAGVPAARIRDMEEVARDPEVRRTALREEPHPGIPGYRAVALPPTLDGRRTAPPRPPPAVGEHTSQILRELGYGAARIQELESRGVVAGGAPGAGEPP